MHRRASVSDACRDTLHSMFRTTGARVAVSIIGALVITALGIDAADTLQGSDGTMLAQLIKRDTPACPVGMQAVDTIPGISCLDLYESSPASSCPHATLKNTLESEENVSTPGCAAASVQGVEPWTYISLAQAQRACASAGKRLPTAAEWYRIALGSEGQTCITNAKTIQKTGTATCIASSGAYDAVGNAWEWIDGQVTNGTYDGRTLPNNGYVSSVDANGIAVTSTDAPDALYGNDYLWSKTDGVYGMIRGGFYGSGDDAGLYTLNAAVPAGFAAQGVGFRCVK